MITSAYMRDAFKNITGSEPELIVRAPGRVNLIGEHTDYNNGFVMPIGIDFGMCIAAKKRNDRIVRLIAMNFDNESSEFSLDLPIPHDTEKRWSNYVRGVVTELLQRGVPVSGADLVLYGDVPRGSGLSSSAALEVCAATLFAELAQTAIAKTDIAVISQRAENEYVGVKCGIMDQFASALAKKDHALLIDCRDLSHRDIPIMQDYAIVVCDTTKRRGLVDSEYNNRRSECEQAAKLLGVSSLRDVSAADFAARSHLLPPVVFKRARHVVTENERTLQAADAAMRNDMRTFGRLMSESHASLRDDYEVSIAELDYMADIAQQHSDCEGARLTGAGFGGCTVNLVRQDAVDNFVQTISEQYATRFNVTPAVYVCKAMPGAGKQEF